MRALFQIIPFLPEFFHPSFMPGLAGGFGVRPARIRQELSRFVLGRAPPHPPMHQSG